DQVAFQEPPYTTSVEFVNHLKENTPDSLQYLVKDMFETITLYDNNALKATYKTLENGKYEVTFKTNVRKYRSTEKGKKKFSDEETSVDESENDPENLKSLQLKDYVEIGVFGETNDEIDGIEKENVLYLKKHLISEIYNEFSIIVDEKPVEAGVDPYNKLIDTNSDDNRVEIEEEE
ncbi:MAG: hypothetical protein ABR595_08530, partial [Psychroflexus sp.]